MCKATEDAKYVARNPYAWPGGWLMVAITSDGGVLCPKCIRSEFYQIAWSCRHEVNNGWRVVDKDCLANWEPDDGQVCDHCYKVLTEM